LKSWVDGQVERGRYRDTSQFFEQAARQMRTVSSPEQIDSALIEALDGALPKPLRRGELRAIEARIRRKYLDRQTSRKSA